MSEKDRRRRPESRSRVVPPGGLAVTAGALGLFHKAVAGWFLDSVGPPTRAQELAWPVILEGQSALLSAPTGSGKTLAAFLAAIQRVMFSAAPARHARCRVLYVSPLKALAVDVERNLRAPLEGIGRRAALAEETVHQPVVAVRSGDTPGDERARMARLPPDILITTPESLFLILTSTARSILASVQVVILDEIHVLVGTKRGAHLALSVERVAEIAGRAIQRIGLSATQRPLETVARYLGGGNGGRPWVPRSVTVLDAGSEKRYDLGVEVPLEEAGGSPAGDTRRGLRGGGPRPAMWPAVYPRLLELIRAHKSTIVFVNSRRLAERLAAALNELAGTELVRAHHGSLAREERLLVEERLKAGHLPALVATSSLELGIDMGAVDLVIQIEAPPSVASGIQRIGRASHQAGAVSRGLLFPKYRGDLLATAAITRAICRGEIEETRMPANPLDVLAQQLVSMAVERERRKADLFQLVRRAAPYANLPEAQFDGVLDMLSGRYPSDRFSDLRPRLTWDRRRGVVRAREGARMLVVFNAGTIPDRGLYGVFLQGPDPRPQISRAGGRRVGELDEEMVFESRIGDVFVLGASSWRILDITRDRVLVAPAPGEPGRMPFWKADRPPRPPGLGRAIGCLTRELAGMTEAEAVARLVSEHALSPRAARVLADYLREQREATAVLPDDRTLVLERFRDELGDWRLCLLSPFGGRVHAPWALALEAHLLRQGEPEIDTVWSDDGIVLRLPDRDRPPDGAALVPDPAEIEELVVGRLASSALFAGCFREAAARALLLPRRRPGRRTPLWMQRKRSHDLLAVASRFPSFPILLEAYRESLSDVFDVPALVELARAVRRRDVRIATVDTTAPSPFAASLLFGYVANYIYDADTPVAERRAHALAVDQRGLRELLGDAELRELIDPGVLTGIEAALQAREDPPRVRSEDRLHDLLLRIGDLSMSEIAARVAPGGIGTKGAKDGAEAAVRLVDALVAARRAVWVSVSGEERLIAAEEAGRYRDAVGAELPPGLPAAFLEPVPDAPGEIVSRYTRTHGPFLPAEIVRRYGMPLDAVMTRLQRLLDAGTVLEGEFRPGGEGREWCDAEILAAARRRSLAHFRRQVEPVEQRVYAAFLADWHGVVPPGSAASDLAGEEALAEALEKLQGAVVPASVLETDILPSRLPGYRPEQLDTLMAAGDVVWVGVAPLGERDGKIALYLADEFPLLHAPPCSSPEGDLRRLIHRILSERGAVFFADLHQAVGGLERLARRALWDLVWAGHVTNDTLGPLRALLGQSLGRRRPPRPLPGAHRRRQGDPAVSGRWGLVGRHTPESPGETRKQLAFAERMLARHGILSREAVAFEGVPGGFAGMYPILSELENRGRIRRGYFVTGLGGSQFADPGALERLRSRREECERNEAPAGTVIAAVDPANAYGAALPWPDHEPRLLRAPGAHVVLVDGRLAAYVSREQRDLFAFLPPDEPLRTSVARAAAAAIRDWAGLSGRVALAWGDRSEDATGRGTFARHLVDAGFQAAGGGFVLPRA